MSSRHSTSYSHTCFLATDDPHRDDGDDLKEEAPLIFLNFSFHCNYCMLMLTQMRHANIDQGCIRYPCFGVAHERGTGTSYEHDYAEE
mmetsp:Transcript_18493/g.31265  ORF Transcript_18493/g.31265 Transcript_18493/m.31265 type:complete len:88 (+) Transcript_18493:60-323(+)